MPLPKSLRQPAKRKNSSSGSNPQLRRKPCRICHNLDPRGHSSSVYQMESSKKASTSLTLVLDGLSLQKNHSCRFCGVLTQALDAFFEGWRGKRGRFTVDLTEKRSIKVRIDDGASKSEIVEIYAGSASRSPWPTLGTAHPIPSNSGSDESFDFARRCIQDCLTNTKHTSCRTSLSSITPKRLLDVGRVTAPIRIIEMGTHPTPEELKYITLSHCWGTGPVLTATKENYYSLARNIPFEKLPSLFQDAIIITRQLGLRYIWIDSLCIIQDSIRDWETESAKMSAIYENSYITISATTSGDSQTHCLSDRRKPVKIDYRNTTGKEFALRARKILNHHPDAKEGTPARPTGPLTTRAWALQEHVLSTRILHYTETELLFECKTSYCCECQPSRKAYSTTPALIPKALGNGKKYGICDAWQHIVSQYSKRELTVPMDKLPAISGIASRIQEATKSDYLAGLWRENLTSDLLWSANPSSNARLEPSWALDAYRAPTFSWASLDRTITYYEPDDHERTLFKPNIEILETEMSLTGLNSLGTVSDGWIRLRGPALYALLTSSEKDGRPEYSLLIKGTSAIQISHDCLLIEDEVPARLGEVEKTVRRARAGEEIKEFKTRVLCLRVASYGDWLSGLVLGLSSRVTGAYERLGTFAAGIGETSRAGSREVKLV
ncbi:HET-domain-containing protein [Zopfia rhizophila CBS 207.26]|uniref:HET-domain-containing protein n=1 Tax=Zopfia rhizophila CBS 207.26 TaxID=1314779 RepID=A0A6A6DUN8_9PEZI|nr:HET-domain-containing protein [Zopfia rhizophila CBS 207.26]